MASHNIQPLLLVGGLSSRMGTRKELLTFPDGRPAISHALETLQTTLPNASTIYISLHDESQLADVKFILDTVTPASEASSATTSHTETNKNQTPPSNPKPPITPIFDLPTTTRIGPAAGLLAAHTLHPQTTFLVIGSDYPLLTPKAFTQLLTSYTPPVTCFRNEEGFAEPLIAIWSPEALERLRERVEGEGRYGLVGVVREIQGKEVRPEKEEWVRGVNTREEWETVREVLLMRVESVETE